jgi:hypothetical protein
MLWRIIILFTTKKAVSLELGWVESIGKVAKTEALQKGVASAGYLMPISEKGLLTLLDHYCNPSLPIKSNCQTVVGIATPATTLAAGALSHPSCSHRPTARSTISTAKILPCPPPPPQQPPIRHIVQYSVFPLQSRRHRRAGAHHQTVQGAIHARGGH